MKKFENESGEMIVIADMDKWHLVHALAKYSSHSGRNLILAEKYADVIKALKTEIINRIKLSESSNNK